MNELGLGVASFPCCYWLTGLPGSGKSTLAIGFADAMREIGEPCLVLDGDEARKGFCCDLGYSARDRSENVRRLGEVAKIGVQSKIVVVVAAISPYAKDRLQVRERFVAGRYIEVFINASASVCGRRDVKGHWAAAKSGNLRNFTGVDDPYEEPIAPGIEIFSDVATVSESIDLLFEHYQRLKNGIC